MIKKTGITFKVLCAGSQPLRELEKTDLKISKLDCVFENRTLNIITDPGPQIYFWGGTFKT